MQKVALNLLWCRSFKNAFPFPLCSCRRAGIGHIWTVPLISLYNLIGNSKVANIHTCKRNESLDIITY